MKYSFVIKSTQDIEAKDMLDAERIILERLKTGRSGLLTITKEETPNE